MGYTLHHFINVTVRGCARAERDENDEIRLRDRGQQSGHLARHLRQRAIEIGLGVSEVYHPPVEDWFFFAVFPDGSKEGWTESDDGDRKRAAFIDELNRWRMGNSPGHIQWMEVQIGDDGNEHKITRHGRQRWRRVQ